MKTSSDVDMVHWAWEDNPDEALCGKDLTGEPWVSDNEPITCKECLKVQDAIVLSEKLGLGTNA